MVTKVRLPFDNFTLTTTSLEKALDIGILLSGLGTLF